MNNKSRFLHGQRIEPPAIDGNMSIVDLIDKTFNAYNARSGNTRWTYEAGNSISGGSTIIGNIVYFATLQNTATIGLDIRTGHRVFSFFDGKFDPVIADGKRLYLDGYRDLYALDPRGAVAARTATPKTTTAR